MPRHIKIGLVVLGVGFAVAFGFFVNIIGRIQTMVGDRDTETNPFRPPAVKLFEPTDPAIMVKLFFPTSGGETLLGAEDRSIFQSSQVANQARQILQALEVGPSGDGLSRSLPNEAIVQDVFVTEDGVAIVDFSSAVSANHPGGILNEQATIYSIVNSLTYNLSGIHQVKILVGGTERETLAGHCLLLLPLEMDLSITNYAN